MIITNLTVSSKLEGQFVSVTVEFEESDDRRPAALTQLALDLKLKTSITCIAHAMADYTLTPDRGREKINQLKSRIAVLKEKVVKP